MENISRDEFRILHTVKNQLHRVVCMGKICDVISMYFQK